MPLLLMLAEALVGPARSIISSTGLRSCAECQRSVGFFSRDSAYHAVQSSGNLGLELLNGSRLVL